MTKCVALARGYLWVSSALALLTGVCAALFYAWRKKKTTPSSSSQMHCGFRNAHSLRSALLWLGAALAGSWGVAGVVTRTSSAYCDSLEQKSELVTLATTIASLCVIGSVALLVGAVLASVQAMAPAQETTPAIVCLRCSCCSQAFKRVLLLAPVALLASVNVVSWHDSRQPHCGSLAPLATTFFGGAALIFLLMALAQLTSFSVSSCSSAFGRRRQKNAPSSPGGGSPASPAAASTLASRKRRRLVILAVLLVISLVCIAWASLGWLWLARASSQPTAEADKCSQPQSIERSMSVSIALLFVVGWVLLTLTLCCRLEDVIVSSGRESPSVDVSALSPKLLRSPRATSSSSLSPSRGEQLRQVSLATAHSDALV